MESIKPRATVIIPAFNAQKTLEPCLQAILNQKEKKIEVIVVDDCSTDDTVKIASQFPVCIVKNSENSGAGFSRNSGARAAQSDYLLFVDSDVVIPPNGVELMLQSLTEKPNTLIVMASYSENTAHLGFFSDYKNMELSYRLAQLPEYLTYVSSFFIAIKKKDFFEADGFSESFKGATVEDVEFGYRACQGKAVTLQERMVQVDHMKEYSFFRLFRTNHSRIENLLKIRKIHAGKYKAGSDRPISYYLNICLSPLIILNFIIYLFSGQFLGSLITMIGLVFLTNVKFLQFLFDRRGIGFALKSLFLIIMEFTGVFISLFISTLRMGIFSSLK
jgi:glycosyltransferase involved in cell wall biosynthesis